MVLVRHEIVRVRQGEHWMIKCTRKQFMLRNVAFSFHAAFSLQNLPPTGGALVAIKYLPLCCELSG